jgi:putative intracellular protease/amidase
LAAPYYVFVDASAETTLASPKGGRPPVDPWSEEPRSQTTATKRFSQDKAAQSALADTTQRASISANDYAAIFYPGGRGPLWDLADDLDSIALIETMYADGRPVAAVCHGPGVFRHTKRPDGAPLVCHKSVTAFSNSEEEAVGLTRVVPFLVEEMLKANGGNYTKGANWQPHSVIDGHLITGQNPASSEAAAKALLTWMTSH